MEEPAEWKVFLNFGTMTATKDCDRDIGGIGNAGEFAYRLSYHVENDDGTWQQKTLQESRAFGNDKGDVIKLKSGEEFKLDVPNSEAFMTEGQKYRLVFSAIEWDGNDRDERMDGSAKWQDEIVGTAGHGSFKDIKIAVGVDANCKVSLVGLTQEFPLQK